VAQKSKPDLRNHTHIAASNAVTDDVTNQVTHRIYDTNL